MKTLVRTVVGVFLLSGLLSATTKTYAYDTSAVHQMLLYLQQEQATGNSDFPNGLFPSYRQYAYNASVLKDDNNFFFTALVIFTLNEIYPKLSKEDKNIVDSIKHKAVLTFKLFKNKNGRATFNFWPTHPPEIFPNSGWMNWFNKPQSLPDDFDDTSIGLLAKKADTSTVERVHQYMQGFVNGRKKRIKNTLRKYRHLSAYSVWFGKHFPVDFDICVLCNTLYLVSAYHLKWTKADSASLKLIARAIQENEILKHPAFIAPHYHSTDVILYHISRLMSVNPQLLRPYKSILIAEAKRQWHLAKNPIEKIMLSSALARWNVAMPQVVRVSDDAPGIKKLAASSFVFFIANMASMLPNPFKKPISRWGIGRFNYYCPAYNIALVLENRVLFQSKP